MAKYNVMGGSAGRLEATDPLDCTSQSLALCENRTQLAFIVHHDLLNKRLHMVRRYVYGRVGESSGISK
jgi:TPP-dependent trihydroxycyclohexane-1,2-dione (THcHDO) dehydratase